MSNSNITIKQRLLSGGIWVLLGKGLTVLSLLIVNALIARLLGPEDVGGYFLALSLVSIFSVVAQLGLGQTAVRFVAESVGRQDLARAAKVIRLVIIYGSAGALVISTILISGAGKWIAEQVLNSPALAGIIGITAIWIIINTLQGLLVESFRGFSDIKLAVTFEGVLTGILCILIFTWLLLVQGQSNLTEVISAFIIASLVNLLIAGLFMYGKLKHVKGKAKISNKDILHTAWPLLITNLAVFVLLHADLWIVSIFSSQEDVAIYGAAMRLVKFVIVPLMLINAIVPPIIAEMYTLDKTQELEETLRTTATLSSIPAFMVLLIFILFSAPLLDFIYGDYYRAGAAILVILSIGQLINVWTGSCAMVLNMTGHQHVMMMISVVTGIITIACAIWLAIHYGPVGVAVATAAGMIIRNVITLIYVKKKTNMWTHIDITVFPRIKQILRISQ